MTGAARLAPSSKLALYLAAVITVYLVRDPVPALVFGAVAVTAALLIVRTAPRPVPRARWRAALIFIAWVFVMRAALDFVTGVPLTDAGVWLAAGRGAMRVAVLAVGVIALIAITSARDIVEELEQSRLPRSARLLVMMLIQYPRVLRDRYEQIVEAQVARGAERPRTIPKRVVHGSALLLPVMQSELNAVGERAALIHLRGLDIEVVRTGESGRTPRDVLALAIAVTAVVVAAAIRIAQ